MEAAEVPLEDQIAKLETPIFSKSIGKVLYYKFTSKMFRMQMYIILLVLAFDVCLWPWSVLRQYIMSG